MKSQVLKADNILEILKLKNHHDKSAGFRAGGTEIGREGTDLSYQILIDLCGADLKFIHTTDTGVEIGACVTFREALAEESIPDYLRTALNYATSEELRQHATIGGNIGVFRNDSYLLPVLIAAKARVVTYDMDEVGKLIEESVPIREFVEHHDLYRYTLITRICLDKPARFAVSYRFVDEKTNLHLLSVGFGAEYQSELDMLTSSRIAIGTSGREMYRLDQTEQALDQGAVQTAEDLAASVANEIAVITDEAGTAEKKRKLAAETVSEAFNRCLRAFSPN